MSSAAPAKGGRGHSKAKSVSRSQKAGLQFPVGRIARFLKKGRYAQRVGSGSPVYLSAVLEYLAAEVLESFLFFSPFPSFSLDKLYFDTVCVSCRFWSLLEMRPGTTRRIGLSRGTYNLQWGTMRSWGNFWEAWLLRAEESCQTFIRICCRRRPGKGRERLGPHLKNSRPD